MVFPEIDPILFQIGPFAIRWYALAYIAGILLGMLYIAFLDRKTPKTLSKALQEDIVLWAVIGIILGGRLGYVAFYNLSYFMHEPLAILRVWEGGMSFHGGLIGLILAIYLLCRKHNQPFLPVMDLISCAAPIGLLFGRIANFINGELYGRITDSPIGVIFPNAGSMPRHPSQLYEAALEGLLLFILLAILTTYTKVQQFPGVLSGIFLLGYSLARMVAEQFREPDAHIGFLFNHATMGQLLSAPMLILGIYLIVRARRAP